MNKFLFYTLFLFPILFFSQKTEELNTTSKTYKKRVLENSELDILTSFYTQNGDNAAVTGGIGTEELNDLAVNINIAIPLNDDDILTIDGTISAYSSASSSNLNPFSSGASNDDDDDDDDDGKGPAGGTGKPITGTPWAAASGASKNDVWKSGVIGYSHATDDRNSVYDANISFASEYDYTSFGAGIGMTKLFNKKNTEVGISANVYIDFWNPQYPTEIHTYIKTNGNLYADFFNGVDILDANGLVIDKSDANAWKPINNTLIENKGRNTYSVSLNFSQIINKRAQFSIFSDIVLQDGWLANPMQRVYFSDKDNFYIGDASDISNYTNSNNKNVFQLADDIERLPTTRVKIPIGIRLNYYLNEYVTLKSYYRYYFDDWGVKSNTFNVEIPIKIGEKYTIYPNFRYYNQTAATYFAPFDKLLSTASYYTSDYDLSKFNASQYGIGIKYTDIFTKTKIWKIGLKNLNFNYNYYKRSTGLNANIISVGTKFIIE